MSKEAGIKTHYTNILIIVPVLQLELFLMRQALGRMAYYLSQATSQQRVCSNTTFRKLQRPKIRIADSTISSTITSNYSLLPISYPLSSSSIANPLPLPPNWHDKTHPNHSLLTRFLSALLPVLLFTHLHQTSSDTQIICKTIIYMLLNLTIVRSTQTIL